MKTHILGFPRIGAKRELKKAVESYWKGDSTQENLRQTCQSLRKRHWEIQKKSGLSFVSTGDFSLYDHVLDITAMLGAVPERFEFSDKTVGLDTYFAMARGNAKQNIPAMEMTKWFNSNYHFIVPEISSTLTPKLSCTKIIDETREACEAGYTPKPVLVGPITYLALSKSVDGYDCWKKCNEIVEVYAEVITRLSNFCEWLQIDEPVLCADMPLQAKNRFKNIYKKLNQAAGPAKLLLATYFDTIDENLDLALNSGCAGIHVDMVRGVYNPASLIKQIPEDMILSAGIVDGRNIWKTDLGRSVDTLSTFKDGLGTERLWIGSSCSLLHSPVDLQNETDLDHELKSWMAFAVQKCAEISMLSKALNNEDCFNEFVENKVAIITRKTSKRVHNDQVRKRCDSISSKMSRRNNAYPKRKKAQEWLKLPVMPTTTIGSFPQTIEIRNQRKLFKTDKISLEEYTSFMKNEISRIIDIQEKLGLDVLVHGEPERNDMVEYFGQQLEGFCFTSNGWVQSYGSRCVKPPIIFGDVSRPRAMTVDWISYAQSLTDKPVKGMLTGPVTILCWSFVRDDLDRSKVAQQIALAIRDEVKDLENAGVKIIQIDEAALSEGMPVKRKDRENYLQWAVEAFRLTVSCVEDSTQIHTHMCYSEFNEIIKYIAEMDADVISIESSRSKMELLNTFQTFEYPNEIGPGVYDIHSPRVPTVEEIVRLLKTACKYIPRKRLWVNPDCGLKTRAWPEVKESLKNMVIAAKQLR